MRRRGLMACAGVAVALAAAPVTWGQEESPAANGDEDAGAAAITEPCPAVLTRNTTLDQDCVGPIAFGANGVQLNLAGHTVTCHDDGTAIGIAAVDRVGNRIVNGAVRDCGTGILLLGAGGHHVANVALTGHDTTGPASRPPTGTFNIGAGLELHGSDGNEVVGVHAARNRVGFLVWMGADDNRFTALDVTEAWPLSGMEIRRGSSRNTVTGSRFAGSPRAGLHVHEGTANVVRSSSATGNLDGIGLGHMALDTVVQHNDTSGNERDGILLLAGARRTTVEGNRAADNARSGIRVASSSTGNELTGNIARGNAVVDLADDTPGCDDNLWLRNHFSTANQPCVR